MSVQIFRKTSSEINGRAMLFSEMRNIEIIKYYQNQKDITLKGLDIINILLYRIDDKRFWFHVRNNEFYELINARRNEGKYEKDYCK